MRNITTKFIIKKVVRKLNKGIYNSFRRIKIKNSAITLSDTFFNSFNSNCIFLYYVDKKEQYKLEARDISTIDKTTISANKICNHEFNLLGSGGKCLGEKLPWHEDFKSAFKWNNKFYKDIKVIDLFNDADVKAPWELSRFQHVFSLGKAYLLTNDEKYVLEFKEEVEDWLDKNPIEMSVNWTCTMDVAIRAVNWICGYSFFKSSGIIDDKFWNQFNKSLYLHGRFIYKNLENQGQHNGNHYLSDLCGLLWLGIYFGNFIVRDNENKNNPEDWLKFGILELESEMKKEINDDGTDYEASTSYHKLVTEIFLLSAILCNKNYIYFSKKYMQRLEKMCEFIMNITKPNGLSPIIGDADDGRLLIISNYGNWNRRDFRHILAVAGEYFNRDDFRYIGKDYKEDVLWIMGSFKEIENKPILSSKAYEMGGYYILRNKRIYCIIRCGELSCRGYGGHSHNDQLSIELNVDGEDFIIDPGTYVYTSDYKMRNTFRSTKYHNTLSIGKLEQNCFYQYDLFYMREETFSECKSFCEDRFCGQHYGYVNKCGVVHERTVEIDQDSVIIKDYLKEQFNTKHKRINIDECRINFILDSGVDIIQKENGVELIKNGKKTFMEFQGDFEINNVFVSYGYRQKVATKQISIIIEEMDSNIKIICPMRS